MKKYKYNEIEALYKFWDDFFQEIYIEHCKNCEYPDCQGYIFLIDTEKDVLYEKGVPLLTLNEEIVLINSLKYDVAKANFDVEEVKPKCCLRQNGKCSVYDTRPLVCRMYPFGFYFEEGKTYFVIFKDCQYTINHFIPNKIIIENRIKELLNNMNPNLLNVIINTFKKIDDISMFPSEEKNEIIKLVEVMGYDI